MAGSVNALIMADRIITVENISVQFGNSVGTRQETVHDDFAFSKVSCREIPKILILEKNCCKNSGNLQSVWLGVAATSSLQFRSGQL